MNLTSRFTLFQESIEPWADQTNVVWQRFCIPHRTASSPIWGIPLANLGVLFDKSVWEIGAVWLLHRYEHAVREIPRCANEWLTY
jgi:hypothetical protein